MLHPSSNPDRGRDQAPLRLRERPPPAPGPHRPVGSATAGIAGHLAWHPAAGSGFWARFDRGPLGRGGQRCLGSVVGLVDGPRLQGRANTFTGVDKAGADASEPGVLSGKAAFAVPRRILIGQIARFSDFGERFVEQVPGEGGNGHLVGWR